MEVRLTPDKGYLHGGENASITFVEAVQLPTDLWTGYRIEFVGDQSTSRASAERIDFRTFHFVVPDHGVPEEVKATLVNDATSLCDSDGMPFSFSFAFVDSFTKISNYLPEGRTHLAVPLVVALGLRDEPHDKETMDRSLIQFYEEKRPQKLNLMSILGEAYPFDDELNLFHFCAEMGLSQFADYLATDASADEYLSAAWQGRRPVDVARDQAHFKGGHYASVHRSLEARTPSFRSAPAAEKPPQVAPRPSQRARGSPGRVAEQTPPALPPHEPEEDEDNIYTDPDESKPRFRFGSMASTLSRKSNDSGVYASNTSMSAYADISLERQKTNCLGTVTATYDYTEGSDDENGMLSLKAGDTIYILSSADDGKWYGIVDDQIGYFYMTFVDHDNIAWRENRKQDVEIQRASVTRDSPPENSSEADAVGFLRVKVNDVVRILAMPESGLYTAELNGRVGYIYDSHVQLIGSQSANWDQAPPEEDFRLGRLPSIYSQPLHLAKVLFKVVAIKDSTLQATEALRFKVGDKISILDSPDSGIWLGRLHGRFGRIAFSDVTKESSAGPKNRSVSSSSSYQSNPHEPPPLPPPAHRVSQPSLPNPPPRRPDPVGRRSTAPYQGLPNSKMMDELKARASQSLPRGATSNSLAWSKGNRSFEQSRQERPPAPLPHASPSGLKPPRMPPRLPPHH